LDWREVERFRKSIGGISVNKENIFRAEVIEIEEKDKQKLIRVICRAEAAQSQDVLDKISALI
jgi:hypothetical protein